MEITEKISTYLKEAEVPLNSIKMTGILRELLENNLRNVDVVQKGNDIEILYRDSYFKISVRTLD